MLVIIRQIVPWVKSLLDVIQQMCSLSQEFAGHHPPNVFLESRVCRMSSGKCSFGWEFAGHHSTTIDDNYQIFGSNLYIYRGTSFFVSYLVRMLLAISQPFLHMQCFCIPLRNMYVTVVCDQITCDICDCLLWAQFRKVCPQCNTVVHAMDGVLLLGSLRAQWNIEKPYCLRKSYYKLQQTKASNASETREQTLHRQY